MKTPKKMAMTGVKSLFFTPESMTLILNTDAGQITLAMSSASAREIVHILTDALICSASSESDPFAEQQFVPADVQPLRLELIQSKLGLEEKLILQYGSEESTHVTFRLTPESARKWANDLLYQLDHKPSGRRH